MLDQAASQTESLQRSMSVHEAVTARRSVKHFDPEHRMSEDEVQHLLSHAILSPTAFNIQHWRIVRVDAAQLRQQIRAVAWDQAQVTDASLLLVLCMDSLTQTLTKPHSEPHRRLGSRRCAQGMAGPCQAPQRRAGPSVRLPAGEPPGAHPRCCAGYQ